MKLHVESPLLELTQLLWRQLDLAADRAARGSREFQIGKGRAANALGASVNASDRRGRGKPFEGTADRHLAAIDRRGHGARTGKGRWSRHRRQSGLQHDLALRTERGCQA